MSRPDKIALYIDPPHHTMRKDQLFNIDNCRFGGDQLLAPYVYLKEFLTSRGIEVHTADYLLDEDSGRNTRRDIKIYTAITSTEHYRTIANRRDVIPSAFFPLECPVVEPSLYRELKKLHTCFRRIMSWSDSKSLEPFTGVPLKITSFCWPQSFSRVHEDIWHRKDRNFLVIMNTNKLPRIYHNELYTERLRAIEYFSRTNDIDLYGVGWDGPPHRLGKTRVPWTVRRMQRYMLGQWQRLKPDPLLSAARRAYRGPAESKPGVLGNYVFSICFENMKLNGWITEKIFDCFFAGTVPVYLGAPNIEEFIPSECFVDMRNFKDYRELKTYLKGLGAQDIQRYRENARDFIGSEKFRPFSKEAFADLFCTFIEEDAGITVL